MEVSSWSSNSPREKSIERCLGCGNNTPYRYLAPDEELTIRVSGSTAVRFDVAGDLVVVAPVRGQAIASGVAIITVRPTELAAERGSGQGAVTVSSGNQRAALDVLIGRPESWQELESRALPLRIMV